MNFLSLALVSLLLLVAGCSQCSSTPPPPEPPKMEGSAGVEGTSQDPNAGAPEETLDNPVDLPDPDDANEELPPEDPSSTEE